MRHQIREEELTFVSVGCGDSFDLDCTTHPATQSLFLVPH